MLDSEYLGGAKSVRSFFNLSASKFGSDNLLDPYVLVEQGGPDRVLGLCDEVDKVWAPGEALVTLNFGR